MKRSIAILALASALLSTAAYAQSLGEKTGVNSTLGIAPRAARFSRLKRGGGIAPLITSSG